MCLPPLRHNGLSIWDSVPGMLCSWLSSTVSSSTMRPLYPSYITANTTTILYHKTRLFLLWYLTQIAVISVTCFHVDCIPHYTESNPCLSCSQLNAQCLAECPIDNSCWVNICLMTGLVMRMSAKGEGEEEEKKRPPQPSIISLFFWTPKGSTV